MAHAVTLTDQLLEQVVGLLTEVRDLLGKEQQPVVGSMQIKEPAAKPAATKAAAKKSATASAKKT